MTRGPNEQWPLRPLLSRLRFRDAGTLIGLILIGLILIGLVVALPSPTFLTGQNLINLLQQSSSNVCIALGMTLVIISGGIDLSVGPLAALASSMLVAGVPIPLVIVAALAVGVAWLILNRSPPGEYFMAVGGNPEAAQIAGAPITLTKLMASMISGLTASVAALVLVGRLRAAKPTMGTLWELDAIAAAAIGGASLMGGGRFSARCSAASSWAPCATA